MHLRTDDVSIRIDGRPILSSVTVAADPGRMLVLAGPSGSGKTTLLNAFGLLSRVDEGTVTAADEDATRWRDGRRRTFWRDHVAFIFQDYGLIEEESIEYNVTVGRRGVLGASRTDRSRVDRVLEHVLLGGRGRERTAGLSGGEKQRVGLARAMFRRADVILADEPTASLDRENRDLVIRFLLEESRRGATVIVATHDDDLMAAADDLLLLGLAE